MQSTLLRLLAPLVLTLPAIALISPTQQAQSLFDGKTLDGWITKGGRYDGNALWSVEEGTITGREGPNSAGGLIYTEKRYTDFEIELDAWITYPFDSGVFLHMVPRDLAVEDGGGKGPQITLDYRPTGEVGGIYADGYYFHQPNGMEKWKRDEWNHLRVSCVGDPMHIVFWLNGELLTDYTLPTSGGVFAKSGHIGLQVHGARSEPEDSVVRFKNIKVKELRRKKAGFWEENNKGQMSLTKSGIASGWRSLFDGKTLDGWKGAGDGSGFAVENGEIAFLKEGSSPHLMTTEDFQDFDLRLEFKIAEMANSGLFLRANRDGSNPAYSGCEIQILDDFNWETVTNSKLAPYQFCGGLYGSIAPGIKDALRPNGEWNSYRVHYHGKRLQVQLNGKLLYDVDTHVIEGKPPFAERAIKGFIGLQRHAPAQVEGKAYAWFRNLFIRTAQVPD
ncbi:MAG: hypothetical protein ACI841_000125 [Planctomycetota bacterium]|jgi:hypothetical protein